MGHYVTDIDHASLPLDHVQTIVTRLNVCLGVTPDQQEAMLAGSMFGWHVAGAGRRHGLH